MTGTKSADINELYGEAIANDKQAEELLFKELSARFLLITRHDVRNDQDCQEIVQNALASIAGKYKDIQFTVSFSAWARKILHNQIMDYYRSPRHREKPDSDLIANAPSPSGDEIDPLLKKRLLECLTKVNSANRRHGRVLVLKYLGYSFTEICEKLSLTRNNAYSMLSRARKMLENCLEKRPV